MEPGNDRSAQLGLGDPERPAGAGLEARYRAELVVGFGIFEVVVSLLAAVSETAWGTSALGALYAVALVPILATLVWLRRGGDPARVAAVLVALVYGLIAVTNLATGGRSLGANMALPTVALFAVLVSSRRMGTFWVAMVVVQILFVAWLRRSNLDFPIRPNPRWVESAIDRIPLYFTVGSAVIGGIVLRAIDNHRERLAQALAGQAEARAHVARSAERFTDFAEVAADGFWETDGELRLTYVSPSFAKAMGMDAAQMIGRTPAQAYLLRFPDQAGVDEFMTPLRRHAPFRDQLIASRDESGRKRWLLNQARPFFDPDGGFAGYRGAVRDVTRYRAAERALRASEERQRLIFDNLPVAIAHVDAQRRFTFNNRTHARWLGSPGADLTGVHVAEVHTPEVMAVIGPHLGEAFAGRRTTFDLDAGSRSYRVTYLPEVDAAGVVVGVFGLMLDVTKIKQVEGELRTLAQFDSLTGLSNRRRFDERLADAIARSERSGETMGLMFLDLDHFKEINDTLGHRAGDLVLQEFARRVSAGTRRTDTVARLAGDEFVIILEPLASALDAETVARKIIAALADPLSIDGHALVVSASIGIAVRGPGEVDGEALLRRADAALYAVKARQRGDFSVASPL